MRARIDYPSLVAGFAIIVLGIILLLDRTGALDLQFGWLLPALAATAGSILLAVGLADRSG